MRLEDGDVITEEAYDEAMDSLSQSQRNELLANVSMRRAQAKEYKRVMAEGPQAEVRRGFWVTTIRWSLIAVGRVLEVMGQIYVLIGSTLRKLGESL